MESLESRIGRLTLEQQKEVEDFVDFLLLKNTIRQAPTFTAPAIVMLNTPPVQSTEPSPLQPLPSVRMQDIVAREELHSPMTSVDPELIHEITVGGDDWVTRDYMDYGKFDLQDSPATEAVKKVKQKIIARQEQETGKHLLDWVD
jgi:hypothetical protein